jgi:hypothetical protein
VSGHSLEWGAGYLPPIQVFRYLAIAALAPSMAVFELFATATPTGFASLWGDGRQNIAVHIKPLAVFLDEARSLVQLAISLTIAEPGHELHGAALVPRLALFYGQNGQPLPGGGADGVAEDGAIAAVPLAGVLGRHQIVHITQAESGVARSHQSLSGRSGQGSLDIRAAAGGLELLAATGAGGERNHGGLS